YSINFTSDYVLVHSYTTRRSSDLGRLVPLSTGSLTMQWRNTSRNYGLTSILLHWIGALAVFGLFGLGLWMVGLNYYSSWYRTAPDRKSTRLNSSHVKISYAVFCLK